MEFSVGLTASGQCFKLNLSLIIFFRKSRREGGSFVLEIQTGGGSCASGNPGERGLKNDPIRWGDVDFFWNNPLFPANLAHGLLQCPRY